MQALIFQDVRDLRVETVPDPVLEQPHEALVRVEVTAVCGSDLHPYRGHERGLDAGTVMGHEFAGEIVDVGAEVRSFKKGMRVASPFSTSCGQCGACKRKLTSRCIHGGVFGWVENGQGLQGVQAELVRVPFADATLVELPGEVSMEAGLLLGDVVPTGWFCADSGEVGPGDRVFVLGCGPIGLMAAQAALDMGAETVYSLDSIPERLELARAFGAEPVHIGETDPIELARELGDEGGADVVLEAVGSPAATELAFACVRPGGVIAAAGVHSEEHFAFSPGDAYDKNLTYRAGRCPARRYMPKLLTAIREERLDPLRIVSHRMPLKDGPRAYGIFDRKEEACTKVLLKP